MMWSPWPSPHHLTFEQKPAFVQLLARGAEPLAGACRTFRIFRQCGYKRLRHCPSMLAAPRPLSLREMEQAVEAAGREWTRQRLRQRPQEAANRQGGVRPGSLSAGNSSSKARQDVATMAVIA